MDRKKLMIIHIFSKKSLRYYYYNIDFSELYSKIKLEYIFLNYILCTFIIIIFDELIFYNPIFYTLIETVLSEGTHDSLPYVRICALSNLTEIDNLI